MSTDGVIDRSTTEDTPIDPMASYKGRTVVWNLCRGNHLGQRSCASAFTGRTYGRNDLIKTLPDPLRGGGRPHMGLGLVAAQVDVVVAAPIPGNPEPRGFAAEALDSGQAFGCAELGPSSRPTRSRPLPHRAWMRMPNLSSVFRNCPVAREFSRACDVENALLRPIVLGAIEFAEPLVGLKIGPQVGQVHVEIAVRQQRIAQRLENASLVATEMIGKDQIERFPGFRLVFVVP